jgi:hypothetical protein
VAESYEQDNQLSDSKQLWDILEYLSDFWLFKEDSAP